MTADMAAPARQYTEDEHRQRVAFAEAMLARAERAVNRAKADAAPQFAAARNAGGDSSRNATFDDLVLGRVTVPVTGGGSTTHDSAIFRLAQAAPPGEHALVPFVEPHALELPDVLAMFQMMFPDLVQQRVSAIWKAMLLKQARKAAGPGRGWYTDEAAGVSTRLVTHHKGKASGRPSFTPTAEFDFVETIEALWVSGQIDPDLVEGLVPADLPAPAAIPGTVEPPSLALGAGEGTPEELAA